MSIRFAPKPSPLLPPARTGVWNTGHASKLQAVINVRPQLAHSLVKALSHAITAASIDDASYGLEISEAISATIEEILEIFPCEE